MANIPSLLESRFNFNPLLQHTFPLSPIKLSSCDNNAFKLKLNYYSPYKVIKDYPKLRTKSFFMIHKPKLKYGIDGNDLKAVAISSGIKEVVWISIKNVVKALQKPVITGVLSGLLLLYDHRVALADLMPFESAVGVGVKPAGGYGHGVDLFVAMMLLSFGVGVGYYLNNILSCMSLKTSVLKLQVGLLGTGKSLQMDLNRIAEIPNTYSRDGLSYVLQETTLALLRHPDNCISGYSSVCMKRSVEEVENRFNQFCIEERAKFDVETLVNFNNIGKQRAKTKRSKNFRKEYSVITIIMAAEGEHKLPPINSSAKLKEALIKLATIPSSRVEALVVYLTPQNENDTFTERKFLEDYSLLHPF